MKNENAKNISAERLQALKDSAMTTLANARRSLLERYPFVGSIALGLEIVPVRDARVRTACTDGKSIYFNLAFLSTLTSEDTLFVFGHEVFHIVMMHFVRAENRDRDLVNVADDLEVNQLLAKDGFSILGSALMPDKLNLPPDLSSEQYYDILSKRGEACRSSFDNHIFAGDRTGPESAPDGITDKYGKVGTDPDFRPCDPKDSMEKTREAVVAAAQVLERQRGELPAHLKGLVQALLTPEIGWRERLQQFVTRSCGGENRSWNPPNRRHAHGGLYLQSRKGEKIRVYAGLDVSGSTAGDIPKFLSELNGLVKTFGRYELSLVQCDVGITDFRTYTDDDPLDLENEKFETTGGGGTDIRPLLDKALELSDEGSRPDAVVIFTDGYTEHFCEDDDPGIPVMWLVSNGGKTDFADFGEITEFKSDGEAA